MTLYIKNSQTIGPAFTGKEAPGCAEAISTGAYELDSDEHRAALEAHTKLMNERAEALGIKARYEVAERE